MKETFSGQFYPERQSRDRNFKTMYKEDGELGRSLQKL